VHGGVALIVPDEIEAYAVAHSTPPSPLLETVAQTTRASMEGHGMMVGPLEGRFLEFLVHLSGARRVLEIGTFTGYSALAMAAALPPDGTIVTCEIDPETAAVARRHFDASPWGDRIRLRVGRALDTLATLDGPFDLVFVDADKENYRNYYEAVLPLLADGGVIAVDNVLWQGRVLDPSDDSPSTRGIVELNDLVRHDPRVVCVMLTVRDGMTLIRRSTG
jgi:caffeoyl-CoA O-methyltransferase